MRYSIGQSLPRSPPELLLHVWCEQPAPCMLLGQECGLSSQCGFARARTGPGGLAASLCSPSLPAGLQRSRLLRFGQEPIFLELSKHLYWEMFNRVSSWRGSRGVQPRTAHTEPPGSDWGCKANPVFMEPGGQWALLAHSAALGVNGAVGAFTSLCNCRAWVLGPF